jgi:hypothetical protein
LFAILLLYGLLKETFMGLLSKCKDTIEDSEKKTRTNYFDALSEKQLHKMQKIVEQ